MKIMNYLKEKNVLGKGLSALLTSTASNLNEANENNTEQLQAVKVDLINPNPFQPRYDFNEQELEELKQSIVEFGILQPILVRKIDNHYQIIAGERRWQAAKRAGLKEIPVIIKDIDDTQLFEIAVIENIQRQNLTPIEEALAFEKFIKELNYTQEKLARRIGKSRSYIANAIRLLQLPEDVKQLIKERKLSAGHARTIINSKNPSEFARKIINENLSVRQAEELVKNEGLSTNKGSKFSGEFSKDKEIINLQNLLSESLGLKVYINQTIRGGEVVVKFNTLEELDVIIQRIGGSELNF